MESAICLAKYAKFELYNQWINLYQVLVKQIQIICYGWDLLADLIQNRCDILVIWKQKKKKKSKPIQSKVKSNFQKLSIKKKKKLKAFLLHQN